MKNGYKVQTNLCQFLDQFRKWFSVTVVSNLIINLHKKL